jgi:hypothetical protein
MKYCPQRPGAAARHFHCGRNAALLVLLCSVAAGAAGRSHDKGLKLSGDDAAQSHSLRQSVLTAAPEDILADAKEFIDKAAGRVATQADAAFEIVGRKYWNKSLGLDQLAPGILGHQCSPVRPGPHPEHLLTYTPNRRCNAPRSPHHTSYCFWYLLAAQASSKDSYLPYCKLCCVLLAKACASQALACVPFYVFLMY